MAKPGDFLVCPLCAQKLAREGGSFKCERGHCFDTARQGYVNLLPVQSKHSLAPGDTREMLLARRAFLGRGHYAPIAEAVEAAAASARPGSLLDIGCGEGYYLERLSRLLPGSVCVGVDISKEAARLACSRSSEVLWLVATAAHLPFADASFDFATAMFSFLPVAELGRVMRKGGIVCEVTAAPEHLREMKEIIYPEVFRREKPLTPCGDALRELSRERVEFRLCLSGQELRELLFMTPHLHRVTPERQALLLERERLELTCAAIVRLMERA